MPISSKLTIGRLCTLSKYLTFIGGRSIAEKEMAENEELNRLVKNGRVVYLSSMFIFNRPRYVEVNSKGGIETYRICVGTR
jgi:hypothetical protein